MPYYRKMAGERLYLSPISQQGTESYLRWMNDREVAIFFGQYYRTVASKEDLKWLYEPGVDTQRYSIVLNEDDTLIGAISLQNIDHLNRNAFLGIFIGDREQRSRGYGTEAIRLLLRYGFSTLNLHNIMLSVNANNTAGISCFRKAGFKEAGRRREWIFSDGEYVDRLYMDLLAREFILGCSLLHETLSENNSLSTKQG